MLVVTLFQLLNTFMFANIKIAWSDDMRTKSNSLPAYSCNPCKFDVPLKSIVGTSGCLILTCSITGRCLLFYFKVITSDHCFKCIKLTFCEEQKTTFGKVTAKISFPTESEARLTDVQITAKPKENRTCKSPPRLARQHTYIRPQHGAICGVYLIHKNV